jgi:hypothetical protein
MALEDKRIDVEGPLDPRVSAAITARLEGGRLPCAAAWDAAGELGVQPLAVGRAADRMQVRLTACQLGLFGPARHTGAQAATDVVVSDAFTEALLGARGEHNEISCARLWHEAERFGVPRLAAGALADRLGIKVRDCNLGTF